MPLPRTRKTFFLSGAIWCTSFLLFAFIAVGLSVTTNPFFSLLIVVGILASTLLADLYRTRHVCGRVCEPKCESLTPMRVEEKSSVSPSSRCSRKGTLSEPCLRSILPVVPRRSFSSPKLHPYYKRPSGHTATFTPARVPREADKTGGDYLPSSVLEYKQATCLGNMSRCYKTAIIYSVPDESVAGSCMSSCLPRSGAAPAAPESRKALLSCERVSETGQKTALPELKSQNIKNESPVQAGQPGKGLTAIRIEKASNLTSPENEATPESFQTKLEHLLPKKQRNVINILRTTRDSDSTANLQSTAQVAAQVQGYTFNGHSSSAERPARILPPALLRRTGSTPNRHESEGFSLPAAESSRSPGLCFPSRLSSSHSKTVSSMDLPLASALSNVNALPPNITSALDKCNAGNVRTTNTSAEMAQSCMNTSNPESSSPSSPGSSGADHVKGSIWRSLSWSPISCSTSEEGSQVPIPGSGGHQRKLLQVPQWVKLEVENLSDARSFSRDSLQTPAQTTTPPCGALVKTDDLPLAPAANGDIDLQERGEACKKNKRKFKFIRRFLKWKRRRQKRPK